MTEQRGDGWRGEFPGHSAHRPGRHACDFCALEKSPAPHHITV